jgi:hypothetical protein
MSEQRVHRNQVLATKRIEIGDRGILNYMKGENISRNIELNEGRRNPPKVLKS